MASHWVVMVACNNCKQLIAPNAKTCPHCGGGVGTNLEDTVFLIGRAVSRLAGRADSTKAAAIWIGVIFLIFLTIVLILADQ